jgi:transposase
VQTEEATVNDNYSLGEIHERLSKSELLPDKHLVDGGYIEASNLVESRRDYDIDLIGPAQNNGRWQQVQGNGF